MTRCRITAEKLIFNCKKRCNHRSVRVALFIIHCIMGRKYFRYPGNSFFHIIMSRNKRSITFFIRRIIISGRYQIIIHGVFILERIAIKNETENYKQQIKMPILPWPRFTGRFLMAFHLLFCAHVLKIFIFSSKLFNKCKKWILAD